MENLYYLLIPFVLLSLYIVTLRAIIYRKMLKRVRPFDVFIILSFYPFGIFHLPLNYPEDLPDRHVLALSKQYDKLLKFYYAFVLIGTLVVIVGLGWELRGRPQV